MNKLETRPTIMIVRRESDSLVLITQADHAALSEIIMSAWRVGNLQVHPRRQIVLVANREHDNGWPSRGQLVRSTRVEKKRAFCCVYVP